MELVDALGVRPGDVVALVGGGGKTSALYRLGRELAGRDLPVVLAGTARFTPPEHGDAPNLIVIDAEAPPHAVPLAGPWPRTIAAGHGAKGRLLPVPLGWVDALHALHPAWTVVIEADGSAMRPFKAPAAHEPAIPSAASLVVTVAGIDAAGRPLDDTHVHRAAIVAALTGAALGAVVDEAVMAAVLGHVDGGRKSVPAGARWIPLLNKAETPERVERAERLAGLLWPAARRTVIAALRREPPVIEIVEAT